MSALSALFRPTSIAIVGASPNGTPAEVLANLERIGSPAEIVLVNPRRDRIGQRPCHPSLAASGRVVDVAAICVRADRVVAALEDAAAAGARSAVVFADGFSAGDEGGAAHKAALDAAVARLGIPLLGPNCMGYLAPAHGSALYIDHIGRMPPAGHVGLVTQSGSVGVAGINATGTLRLSAMISVGNEAGIRIADAIDFLATDGVTRAIAVFTEGVADGRGLVAAVRRATAAGVRVAVCKTGRSEPAARAAQSHTGALANDHAVFRAALEAAGAAVVGDLDELFAAAELLATGRPLGRRLAGFTLSGGHVGLLNDIAEPNGLSFPLPAPERHRQIEVALGAPRSIANPLDCWVNDDVTGAVDRAADALADWPEVEGFVFAVDTPADPPTSFVDMGRSIAAAAARLATRDPRPVIMQATSLAADDPAVIATLAGAGVPRLTSLAATFAAWSAIARADCALRLPVSPLPAASAIGPADEAGLYAALGAIGIHSPRHRACRTADEAVAAAAALGGPVVVKVLSLAIVHKTELGGVAVGLRDAEAVREAATRMLAIPGATGVLVAEMAPPGLEAFVGARTDPAFGPVLVIGMGGITAELFGDVATLPAPASPEAVLSALAPLKFSRLLAGFRGAPAVDPGPLAALASRLGAAIATADPALAIDLNPVRLVGGRAIVLDAKVTVAQ